MAVLPDGNQDGRRLDNPAMFMLGSLTTAPACRYIIAALLHRTVPISLLIDG
jgi:hypothetical protein